MNKSLLFASTALFTVASLASAQNQSYFTDNLGDVNGVADNGRFVAITDVESSSDPDSGLAGGIAYLWSADNPTVFQNISADIAATAGLPSAERIVGTSAYDVTNDGKMVVGTLCYADGHTNPAIYVDGKWSNLPLPATAMNTNDALAVTPDGSVIGGVCFMMDPTADQGGRYYPVQWKRQSNGEYELVTFNIKLPDHQGFYPMAMSPDGRVIAGRVYCGVQSSVPGLLVDGELRLFNEIEDKYEPWIYKGKYYCGVGEDGKQIWTTDPNDPRIVLFKETYIDGFKDKDVAIDDFIANCDADGNFYGRRTLITNVTEEGNATLTSGAAIYNINTGEWTQNVNESGYVAGVGTDLLFTMKGSVIKEGKSSSVAAAYGIVSDRTIVGVTKISVNGKILGGQTMETNPATGEPQYFPFVTVTENAFSGVSTVYGGSENVSFIVSGRDIRVNNAEEMMVYDLSGKLVAKGANVSVAPGVYVLRAGETTAKIAVR